MDSKMQLKEMGTREGPLLSELPQPPQRKRGAFLSVQCAPLAACSPSFQVALTTYFSNTARLDCSLPPSRTHIAAPKEILLNWLLKHVLPHQTPRLLPQPLAISSLFLSCQQNKEIIFSKAHPQVGKDNILKYHSAIMISTAHSRRKNCRLWQPSVSMDDIKS